MCIDPAPLGIGYSVITPAGVILPIWLPKFCVNHKLPSGPAVIPTGKLVFPYGVLGALRIGYSVITPVGVILPILFPMASVNHRLPSGPAAISYRATTVVGIGNS